jgi:hypothetical protein
VPGNVAMGPTARRWREAWRQRLHPRKLEPNIVSVFGLSFLTSRDCRQLPQDPHARFPCPIPMPPTHPAASGSKTTVMTLAACGLDASSFTRSSLCTCEHRFLCPLPHLPNSQFLYGLGQMCPFEGIYCSILSSCSC